MAEKKKGVMSDEERAQLVAKMDKDLEEYMEKLERTNSKYMDGWNEQTWEKEMQEHPFFTQNISGDQELSPLLQGIQDLKYSPDENTPEELAKNYKEDGNFNFKCKKYRFAIASYTEGLKFKCADENLNAQLLSNRAAAHFRIGNYRSALLDCRLALKKVPNHFKAVLKGVECCLHLQRFEEGRNLCSLGLDMVPISDDEREKLETVKSELVKKEKEMSRNARRQALADKRKQLEEKRILEAIQDRGIKVSEDPGRALSLEDLEPTHPAAIRKRVHFSSENPNTLVWPVIFLYPEHGETDFIECFDEDQVFYDHLQAMFGAQVDRAPWDAEGKYKPEEIKIYFEDTEKNALVEVDCKMTLKSVLSNHRYHVIGGTPGFFLLVDKSPFHKDFLAKYN